MATFHPTDIAKWSEEFKNLDNARQLEYAILYSTIRKTMEADEMQHFLSCLDNFEGNPTFPFRGYIYYYVRGYFLVQFNARAQAGTI